jgi:hypothetical protein
MRADMGSRRSNRRKKMIRLERVLLDAIDALDIGWPTVAGALTPCCTRALPTRAVKTVYRAMRRE